MQQTQSPKAGERHALAMSITGAGREAILERTQHAPGPWWNVGTGILAGDKNDPQVIASTETDDIMNVERAEEQEANARLIAAAPELLELLYCIVHQARAEQLNAAWIVEHGQPLLAKAEGTNL